MIIDNYCGISRIFQIYFKKNRLKYRIILRRRERIFGICEYKYQLRVCDRRKGQLGIRTWGFIGYGIGWYYF